MSGAAAAPDTFASPVAATRTGQPPGLSAAEVGDRVAAGATNAFRPSTGREYRDILRDNLITPFNITLVSLLGALLVLGQIGDSFLSGGAVLVNTVASLVQEVRPSARWTGSPASHAARSASGATTRSGRSRPRSWSWTTSSTSGRETGSAWTAPSSGAMRSRSTRA
jgi:hypothetical protein